MAARTWRTGLLVAANVAALSLLVPLLGRPAPTPTVTVRPVLARLGDVHSTTGAYLTWGRRPPLLSASRFRIRRGLPETFQGEPPAWQANPVNVSLYGLQEWSYFVERGGAEHRAAALRAADWLASTQEPDGRWLYQFSYEYVPGIEVRAPWASALAQGQALALLARTYAATHSPRYLDAGRTALRPFGLSVGQGGVLGHIDGLPFYEELAVEPETHILNGFVSTLLGLYDFADVTHDPTARALFDAGGATLDAVIGRYDMADHPGYDLIDPPHYNRDYDYLVADLLVALHSVAPSPSLAQWIARWYPSLR